MLEVVAIVLDRRDLDRRIGAAVAGEQVGQHIAGDQRGDAELQPAGGDVLAAAEEGAPRIRHVGQDLGGVAQELMALVGDVQAARMALEQLDAEIALQFLDRLGDRGLRDRQVLRGARNRALLGDGDEILQLPDGEGHGATKHGEASGGKRRAFRPCVADSAPRLRRLQQCLRAPAFSMAAAMSRGGGMSVASSLKASKPQTWTRPCRPNLVWSVTTTRAACRASARRARTPPPPAHSP